MRRLGRGGVTPRPRRALSCFRGLPPLIFLKLQYRNVKTEMLKCWVPFLSVVPPALVRLNSVCYICGGILYY